MATVQNSTGFSYAQAAKWRASATPSSKVTSGVATPATGSFSEATGSSNWAEEVEIDRPQDGQRPTAQVKPAEVKGNAVERTKMEDRAQSSASSISSPDLAASASSTSNEEVSSTLANGNASETTWESKSTISATAEPSWIAAREKRLNEEKDKDSSNEAAKKKNKTDGPEEPPPKPVVYTEAAPPIVNPWAKRAEEARAKAAAVVTPPTPRPVPTPAVQASTESKDSRRPRAEVRKKANSIAGVQGMKDVTNTSNEGSQPKRSDDARWAKPYSKASAEPTTSNASAAPSISSRPSHGERQSLPNLPTRPPPSVKDEISWPTPETAKEQDRKAAADKLADKQPEDSKDDDSALSSKKGKKDWKPMPVVPNILWETQEVKARGGRGQPIPERGGRGAGGGPRGRGGHRGGPNTVGGSDRNARAGQSIDGTTRSQFDEINTSQHKAPRASSAGSPQARLTRPERSQRGSINEAPKNSHDAIASAGFGVDARPAVVANTSMPIEAVSQEEKDEDEIAGPAPRPDVSSSQASNTVNPIDATPRGPPAAKSTSTDNRRDRQYDGFKEPNWTGHRGGKRNSRGRGHTREFANGTHHSYNASHVDFGSSFGHSPGTSAYGPIRGGSHNSFNPQATRPLWRNNSARSQSIPVDNYYGRYPNAYPSNVNTYIPNAYDQLNYPMTAMPFTGILDHGYLMEMVKTQLEYYFSVDNLLKDMFLRKHMDSQGFVFLDMIAGFNRIRQLTQDLDLIKSVCIASESLDIRVGEDGRERLRSLKDWGQFVLPMAERDAAAQVDGPQRLHNPQPPTLQTYGLPYGVRGPASAGPFPTTQRPDRRSYDSTFSMANEAQYPPTFSSIPEAAYSDLAAGEERRGRSARSPLPPGTVSPNSQLEPLDGEYDGESDAFPDSQIENLAVVVRSETADKRPRLPYHTLAARTFSNGSIDTHSIFVDGEKAAEPQSNGEFVGGKSESPPSPSAGVVRSPNGDIADGSDISLFWVKDKDVPVESLPPNVQPEPYVQLRAKALDQRNHAATGNCPYDMDVLYQFWSHFLIRNFNKRMYCEFKQLANADAKTRHNNVGLTNLIKYYFESVCSPKPMRDRVLGDYVDIITAESHGVGDPALKELRSAWRKPHGINVINRKLLSDVISDELRKQLDEA